MRVSMWNYRRTDMRINSSAQVAFIMSRAELNLQERKKGNGVDEALVEKS